MANEPRSLLRFVQLRRLSDATAEVCTTGPLVIEPCFDFHDDWSGPVQEAVLAGNRKRGRELYRERQDALSDPGVQAAKLALSLLRRAMVNQRLKVGNLRERVNAWLQVSQLTDKSARHAITNATTWAVDMLTLRRWLRLGSDYGTSESDRIIRGLVLVRLAKSKAEDVCQVRSLIDGHVLHLPIPEPAADPLQEKADQIATLRRDLARMKIRTSAVSRKTDPTLAELRTAEFPDLDKSIELLERTANELGLTATTKVSAIQRVLDVEYAETRRILNARISLEMQPSPIELEDVGSVLDSPDRHLDERDGDRGHADA